MGIGPAESGGKQHVAQLVRVTDRFPLVLALGSDSRHGSPPAASPDPTSAASPASTDAKQLLCLVVKIRPKLLHFLVNGQVWCVIRSRVPITGVARLNQVDIGDSDAGDSCHKLVIAVADGNVWMVTLPTRSQLGMGAMTRDLVLEHGTSEPAPSAFTMGLSGPSITPTQCFNAADDVPMHARHTHKDLSATGSVERFYTLPGVQSVEYVPGVAGSPSLVLMRSLITPSTLVMSARDRSFDTGELQKTSIELDGIEGDQSICTLCLNGQEATHRSLLAWLFPSMIDVASTVVILQGDLDGSVRFALVRLPSGQDIPNATTLQSGTLLALGQPVQAIVPFATSSRSGGPSSPSEGRKTEPPQAFDALLVLGTQGRIGLVASSDTGFVGSYPVSWKKLEIGSSIQSLVFVRSLAAMIYCVKGSAYVCRCAELLAEGLSSNSEATVSGSSSTRATKLPLPPGIIRLAVHEDSQGISFLFASGRVQTMDICSLRATGATVVPLPDRQDQANQHPTGTPEEEASNESRVRNLLHRIAQISTESASLRSQSQQIDLQLKTVHSALEMQRLVETDGIESVVKCHLSASMVTAGGVFDRKTVKLACSISVTKPEMVVSYANWWVCLYVHTRDQVATTYSFPLRNPSTSAIGGERSVVLDPDTLASQDQAAVKVSCSLVFCPAGNHSPDIKQGKYDSAGSKSQREDLFSLSFPLVEDRTFLLAQLSQPIEEDVPVSQLAIRAAFRQEHEPHLRVTRIGGGSNKAEESSSALWSGFQWWAALAVHAQRNPSFASLWAKVAPPKSTPIELSPPSRFVMTIPHFFHSEDEDDDDEEDDDVVDKVRVERMVEFLLKLLEVPLGEASRLRRCCRTQHGKLWVMLRTFSGSVVLLRFIPAEDRQRSLSLTVQCSDVTDLSAMRALVLEAITSWNEGERRGFDDEESSWEELALDVGEMLEPIASLESLLEDLTVKTARNLEDPQAAICTDEVLHALSQLAHVETQTLALYWKTRLILNKTIM